MRDSAIPRTPGTSGVKRALGRLARAARPEVLRNTVRATIDEDVAILKWSSSAETKENWGDALNPLLINGLTGRRVIKSNRVVNLRRDPVYAVVGSILDNAWERHLVVWGSGFKHAGATVQREPRVVHAVRGPLTRDRLLQLGISCPRVFGDPALLYPQIYRPARQTRYALGIVPHYVDSAHPLLAPFEESPDVLIIDVTGGVNHVVDAIHQCSVIASSSLHGIIAAEAYGIPAVWVQLSDRIAGWPFKFRDYYLSTGRTVEPVALADSRPITVGSLVDRAVPPDLSRIDLEGLLGVCPLL
jgi:pyruvyltransferase